MPLVQSGSKKALGENIGKEVGAGKPPEQAAAIAYATQRANDEDMPPSMVLNNIKTQNGNWKNP